MADIDLFSLAKIISNSASGLVGYYFARLNKSRYPPLRCPISVYSLLCSGSRLSAKKIQWLNGNKKFFVDIRFSCFYATVLLK